MGSTRKDIGWSMWKYCFQLDSKQIQLVVDMLSKGSPILQNQYVTEQGVNNSGGPQKSRFIQKISKEHNTIVHESL